MKRFLIILLLIFPIALADCHDNYEVRSMDDRDNMYVFGLQNVQNNFTFFIQNNGKTPFVPTIKFRTYRLSALYSVDYIRDYWITINAPTTIIVPGQTVVYNGSILYTEKLDESTTYFGEINVSCDTFSKSLKVLLQPTTPPPSVSGSTDTPKGFIKLGNYYISRNVMFLFGVLLFLVWIWNRSRGAGSLNDIILLISIVLLMLGLIGVFGYG